MKYRGLYYIPNPGTQLDVSTGLVQSLVSSVERNYPRVTREGEWRLNHRLFRDIPPRQANEDPNMQKGYAHTYRHMFHLSNLNDRSTYDYVQPPRQTAPQPGQMTTPASSPIGPIVTMPVGQAESVYAMTLTYLAALWTPQRSVEIPRGITYAARGATIHIGELRSRRQGPQSANISSPGVVVCISIHAGADDDILNDPHFPVGEEEALDLEPAQERIREMWRIIKKDIDFGKADVREFMQAERDFSGDKTAEQEAAVRMWCDALKPRT